MLRLHRFLSLLLVLSGLLRPAALSSERVETAAFGALSGLSVAAPSADTDRRLAYRTGAALKVLRFKTAV